MARKRTLYTFKEVADRGAYDEYPVLPADIDPQLHLSHNDRDQPFFLICEKDCVLVQMTGASRIVFKDSSVNYQDAAPGDFVYVPARTPHRILPTRPSIHYRYKAMKPGFEAVAWYCEACGGRLSIEAWDANEELPQEGYLRACTAFNADATRRRCACGRDHPPIDLTPYRWAEVARELRAEMTDEDEW